MISKFSKDDMQEVNTIAIDTLALIEKSKTQSEKVEALINFYANAYQTGGEDASLRTLKFVNELLYDEV